MDLSSFYLIVLSYTIKPTVFKFIKLNTKKNENRLSKKTRK